MGVVYSAFFDEMQKTKEDAKARAKSILDAIGRYEKATGKVM